MKALAHRLRGRRASRRGEHEREQDDAERSFRFEEAVQDDSHFSHHKREERTADDHATPRDRHQGNWRKNRGLNSKTGSCNALAALAATSSSQSSTDDVSASDGNSPAHRKHKPPQGRTPSATKVESPQQQNQQGLLRAHSTSRTNSRPQMDVCINSPTSSSQASNGSAGRRTRSRHGGSMSSNASFLSVNNHKPEAAVDVQYSGYLQIKRGLLKVADKRYYFVARRNPELYSCKDETSFSLWLASGHPLDPLGGDPIARASGLSPVLVGTVLRADSLSGEGEGSKGGNHSEKVFSVVVGSASKCFTLRFGAENREKAAAWLDALQQVQVTKRQGSSHPEKENSASDKRLLLPLNEHNGLRGPDSIAILENPGADAATVAGEVVLLVDETNADSVAARPASTSNAKMPRAYAGGKLQSKPRVTEEDEATAVSTPTSHAGSSPTSTSTSSDHAEASTAVAPPAQVLPPARLHRMDSVTSGSSTASGQSQSSTNGNVLLFVPVAGSSLTASASRMAKAQQELDVLVVKGAKRPARVMQDDSNGEAIEWRYGVPEYVLSDLAYVKGRVREPDTTPLASYVEECCQTFIMEATHMARYDQWRSVVQESFYLQVNDGLQVSGASILENDMLGLLYLGDVEASMSVDHGGNDESQDPRAELAEAFPDGFPMEVLEVFTQPPQCYFSWRHWGPFTGKYRGIKGDGSKVEVRGFGNMTVDASRMRSLRLFFKQKDLFSGLRHATDRVARARRDTATISSLSSMNAAPVRTVRATSAAVAPVTRKGSVSNPKTSEIIEGLANFTIEAKEQQRKQTR